MTIENQLRDILREKAERLPDPESLLHILPPQRPRIHGPLVAVAAAVLVLALGSIPLFLAGLSERPESPAGAVAFDAGSNADPKTGSEASSTDDPVAYALGLDLEGWEIRAVAEDQSGTREVIMLDMSAGPVDREGVLPGMSIVVGPVANSQLSDVEEGSITPESTLDIKGVDAALVASGTDENGLESGVVVWRTAQGDAVWVEYNRLATDTARELLETLRPLDQAEWNQLVETTMGEDVDHFQQP